MDRNVCLDTVKKYQHACDRSHEEKINFEGTENGCCGNQPQPLEVSYYSTDASSSCPFPKQDMIFK